MTDEKVNKSSGVLTLKNGMAGPERMPALDMDAMDERQKAAAQELIAGPRGAVFGPFIPLLRSPELMNRLQKVGEYLRYQSVLETRISEFIMLIVSRDWTQQFEWCMHYPLALKAGIKEETLASLAEGRRPASMAPDEELAYEVCEELVRTHGLSDGTYQAAQLAFGEQGIIDMLGLIGYFTTVSMIMNVAHTPPLSVSAAEPLRPFPM